MSNHIKKLWGHYVMLAITIITLIFPIFWVDKIVQEYIGDKPAMLATTVTVIVIMIFGVNGAVYTHKILSKLREELNERENQSPFAETEIPLVLKIFKIEDCCSRAPSFGNEAENKSDVRDCLISLPRKRRGKQSRFQEEKIRKAVLKWEDRDPSFSARTLEEFLYQEFGSGPDGILLMAPTTFYDWRRRVLKETEGKSDRR